MNKPRNMFDKIWDRHVVAQRDDGEALIYVDRNFVHEGPFYAFDKLRLAKRAMRRPLKQIAISDHYLPTLNRAGGLAGIKDPEIRNMVEQLQRNARDFKLPFIGMEDTERQGIMHVVGPDLGLVQPGMVITAADSHTTTNGAFGAFSFGIGASEIKHVMATQALWYRKPKTLRVTIDGKLGAGITAKDVILAIIAKIGISGGNGHVIEYAGAVMRAMTMEQRMTVCNMSIEAAARAGLVAPDDTTYKLPGRPRVCAARRAVGPGAQILAKPAERCRCEVRQGSRAQRRRHRADGHVGHGARRRAADHRQSARSRAGGEQGGARAPRARAATTWD